MKSNGKGCRSKLQCATLVETALLLCAEPNTIIAPNVGALVYLYTTRFDELDLIVGSTLLQTSLRTVPTSNLFVLRLTNEMSDVWNGPDYFEIYTVVEDNKKNLYRYNQH